MDDSDVESLDLFCPCCNVVVQAEVRANARGEITEEIVSRVEPDDLEFLRVRYHIALCCRCSSPFLVESAVRENPGDFSRLTSTRVLFPTERALSGADLPEIISRSYQDAVRAYGAGLYDACAILCRKSLEAICAEAGAEGDNLARRLSSLRGAGVIDQRLFMWADQLRIVGNDAAHDLEVVTEREDARDAVEFMEAIVTYVFVLGRRFDAFVHRRQPGRESPGQSNDPC